MHPTPAASRAISTAIVRHTEATETACLPPSIHSLVHFLPSLPTCRYIPTNSISPKLRLRCAALRSQSQSHSFPPSLFPRPFFRPYPVDLGASAPERSFPARPSTAAAPHHYIYLGTPQVARVRQLPGRARLPTSHPHLLPLRLGSTRPDRTHDQHPRPTTLSPPPRSFLKLCTHPPAHLRVVVITKVESDTTTYTGQADEYRRQRGPAWRAFRRDRAWPATATQWPQTRQQKLATAQLAVEATVLTRGR